MFFKESVIIPYAMFKSCDFEKGSDSAKLLDKENDNYILARQRELMQERMFNKEKYPVFTTYIPSSSGQIQAIPDKISISEILNNISVSQRPNVESILKKLIENSGKWDEHGVLSLNNKVIPGSNIITLMQYISKSKDFAIKPAGVLQLLKFFVDIKLPKSWIKLKPEKLEKKLGKTSLTPVKYPLEDSEKLNVLSSLAKASAVVDSRLQSDDDDEYFSPLSSTKKAGNVNIGKIDKIPPPSFDEAKEVPTYEELFSFKEPSFEKRKLSTEFSPNLSELFSEKSKFDKKSNTVGKEKKKKRKKLTEYERSSDEVQTKFDEQLREDIYEKGKSKNSSKKDTSNYPEKSRAGRVYKHTAKWQALPSWTPNPKKAVKD